MNVLKIKGVDSDCEVNLDREKGEFEFSGRFLPSRTREFFEPIIEFISDYAKDPQKKSTLIFKVDYFNTATSKKFLDIFMLFQEIHSNTMGVQIEWFYHNDDIDLKDAGFGYSNLVDIPFIYKEY